MKKSKFFPFIIFSIVLFIYGLGLGIVSAVVSNPFIDKSSVNYEMNEDNIVTTLKITVKNPSLKKVNLKFILRYCREDDYPEGYTEEIDITLRPFENQVVEIGDFRNSWYYVKGNHLQVDLPSYLEEQTTMFGIKNHDELFPLTLISLISMPISIVGIITFSILSKKQKTKQKAIKNK